MKGHKTDISEIYNCTTWNDGKLSFTIVQLEMTENSYLRDFSA